MRTSLSGEGWLVQAKPKRLDELHASGKFSQLTAEVKQKLATPMPCSVPCEPHLLLMQQGLLTQGDFFHGYNDTEYRWIAHLDWTFERTVPLPKPMPKHLLLFFQGLDTVAEIHINKFPLAQTENMFHRPTVDLTPFVDAKKDAFTLTIHFKNMIEYGKDRADEYPYVVPDDFTPVTQGERFRNYTRKEQCSFSWDWGPCFLPCGIWRDIELIALNDCMITDVLAHVHLSHMMDGYNMWNLGIDIALVSDIEREVTLEVTLLDYISTNRHKCKVGHQMLNTFMNLPESAVKTWWPHGYGEQPLYELGVRILSADEATAYDTKKIRIGFRDVKLVQFPMFQQDGSCFHFQVNGVLMFMKGANFIPVDPFESRVTKERLRQLLMSCTEANMNMIRVWGGGVYQQDAFYDLCDELGILVWQEFMFACAMVSCTPY
jgi:beta-mannosidase